MNESQIMVAEAIEEAAKAFGSQEKLAGFFGFRKAAVTHWKSKGYVPPEHCPAIERRCDGKVPCERLCPAQQWVRVPDDSWPHPGGRPLVDHSAPLEAPAEQGA